MFADMLEGYEPLTLEAARASWLKFQPGTRHRNLARLWLAWLAHTRFCQQYGQTPQSEPCTYYETIAEFLVAFPHWDCCDVHRQLCGARFELIERARRFEAQFEVQPDPELEILSADWWSAQHFFYVFDPRRKIVEKPYDGMGDN
ncbi:MAG TPA: hypothetical protein VM581_02460 [Magnetospirillaceae bacterium]|nr:hypothetical protein [Magnetospirillaceae bacterium]